MTLRKLSYLQGTTEAPYKLPAEDHRLNHAMLWTPDNAAPKGALGVRSGIVFGPGSPGKCTVVAGGVNINPFHFVVQGSVTQTQGPIEGTSDAVEFRAITRASATEFRRGYVIVHVYDQLNAGDHDGWDIEVIYGGNAATAGAATLPSLPANSFAVQEFAVDNNSVITLVGGQRYTVPRGVALPVNDQAERDALFAYSRLEVFRLDLGVYETYYGGGWTVSGGAGAWVALGSGGSSYNAAATGSWADLPGMTGTITVPAGRVVDVELRVPRLRAETSGGVNLRLLANGGAIDDCSAAAGPFGAIEFPGPTLTGAFTSNGGGVLIQAQIVGTGGGGAVMGGLNLGPRLRYREKR